MLRRLVLALLASRSSPPALRSQAPPPSPHRTRGPAFFQEGKLRVLLLSGRNNHDWRTTTPFLRQLLVDTGRFDVRVVEEPAGLTAQTLAVYDLVVSDYCGPRWGAATEQALVDFVRAGKGLVPCTARRTVSRATTCWPTGTSGPDHGADLEGARGDGRRLVAQRPDEAVPRRPPLLRGAPRGPRAPGLERSRRGLHRDRRALPPDDGAALGPRPRHRVERIRPPAERARTSRSCGSTPSAGAGRTSPHSATRWRPCRTRASRPLSSVGRVGSHG